MTNSSILHHYPSVMHKEVLKTCFMSDLYGSGWSMNRINQNFFLLMPCDHNWLRVCLDVQRKWSLSFLCGRSSLLTISSPLKEDSLIHQLIVSQSLQSKLFVCLFLVHSSPFFQEKLMFSEFWPFSLTSEDDFQVCGELTVLLRLGQVTMGLYQGVLVLLSGPLLASGVVCPLLTLGSSAIESSFGERMI